MILGIFISQQMLTKTLFSWKYQLPIYTLKLIKNYCKYFVFRSFNNAKIKLNSQCLRYDVHSINMHIFIFYALMFYINVRFIYNKIMLFFLEFILKNQIGKIQLHTITKKHLLEKYFI